MYSKYNIESKVNCNQYGALLSGATGSLGLGGSTGVGGGAGGGYGGSTATSSASTDVSPSVSGISGGGFQPVINLSFQPEVQKNQDINNPLEMFAGMNWVYIGLALLGIFMFFIIFRKT